MKWKNVRLGDYVKVISGYAFKSGDFVTNGGIPVIKIRNIQKEYVDFSETYYLPNEFLGVDSKFQVNKDDILISLTGSNITLPNSVVGRVARYREEFVSLLNQRAGKIIVNKPDELDNGFLYYYLCKNDVRREIALFGQGGANQCNISPGNVESIYIPLPDISIQQKISSILSAYDDLIENNNKRIKLLEEAAQNIYKEWFVNFRFLGYEKVKFENGLPKGWQNENVNKIFSINYGKMLPTIVITEKGKYPVYGASGVIGYHEEKNVSEKVPLITSRGNGSGEVFRTIFEEAFVTNNSFTVLANEGYEFIPFFFTTELLKTLNLKKYCSGSAQPQLTNAAMKNIEITLPSKRIVERFAEVCKPAIVLCDQLHLQNQKLKEARDILLPRLMNGSIAVDAAVKELEEAF